MRLGQKAMKSLKSVVDNDGDVSEFDINYTKMGQGSEATPTMMKAGVNVNYAVAGLLSEAEKTYSKYDLKEIVKLSSAFYILKHIPSKIKRMDSVMGTNFYAELEKQKEIEEEAWQKAHGGVAPQDFTKRASNDKLENPMDDSNMPLASSRVPTSSIKCFKCGSDVPADQMVCPSCKTQVLSPCSVCGNNFPANEKKCPICNTEY